MIAAPFVALTVYMLKEDWRAALIAWAILLLFCACYWAGTYLMKVQ